jgi:hypothetical protein
MRRLVNIAETVFVFLLVHDTILVPPTRATYSVHTRVLASGAARMVVTGIAAKRHAGRTDSGFSVEDDFTGLEIAARITIVMNILGWLGILIPSILQGYDINRYFILGDHTQYPPERQEG